MSGYTPLNLKVMGICAVLLTTLTFAWMGKPSSTKVFATTPDSEPQEPANQKRFLRHVVMFKFIDGTPEEQVREIETQFAALPQNIQAIFDFEWGTDVSVENLQQGFTHCFVVTFQSEEDRATYLPHPQHLKFVQLVKPHVDKVLVVDYWTR
jgi:hypothetical protein